MADVTILKIANNSYNIKDSVARTGLNEKIGKVTGATADDIPKLTSAGLLVDSGKKLTDYYLKTEVNSLLNAKANQSDLTALTQTVNSKANQSDLTALTQTVNSKANQSDLNTLSGTVEDLSGDVALLDTDVQGLQTSKQDALVSGTNIKTVNGESLLGSGNISITGAWTIAVANEEITFTSM